MESVDNAQLYLLDVGAEEPQNFALTRVAPERELLGRRRPLEVSVDLQRTGPAGERVVELFLLDAEGQPQKRAQQSVACQPGVTEAIELH